MPEETPLDLVKFLKTPLLQKNSGRLLLKCGHFNNEARDIDYICCFIALAKIPERKGSISPSSFYGNLPGY